MKPDWIELIETVYAPADDDVTWAQRVTDLGKSVFGEARLFGMTAFQHDAACTSLRPLMVHGLPRTTADVMAGVDSLGPTFIRAMFYPAQIVTTHVELAEKLPPFARDYMAAFRKGWGCADGLRLCVHPEPGIPLVFYAGYDRVLELTPYQRRLLTRIGLHLETAYRLRRRPEVVLAVVSAKGRILHREDGAPSSLALTNQIARRASAHASQSQAPRCGGALGHARRRAREPRRAQGGLAAPLSRRRERSGDAADASAHER